MGCKFGCTEHDHYGARLRAKGVSVSPSATPTRFRHGTLRQPQAPSWEKGIVTEKRADGSVAPMLDEHLRPIHVKEYGQRRREFDAERERLKASPAPS